MAEQLHDPEFWLPTKFLTDDDIIMKKENLKKKNGVFNKTELLISSHGFPSEFPYEFDSFDSFSALSSPVESVVGSTETESSDEDEFLAGLTHRLANSTSHKLSVPSLSLDKNEKTIVLACSPQSTLSGLGSCSASSNGSPNGSSLIPSPPPTPFVAQTSTWDLIYAAADQVSRLKMSNEALKYANFNSERGLTKAQNQAFMKNSSSGLYSSQSLSHNLAQTNQYHGRQEQVLKPQCGAVLGRQMKATQLQQQQLQQIHCRSRNHVVRGRTLGFGQFSWPLQFQSQQQQQLQRNSGSGMRAMFLYGSRSVKSECAGTGVFLPRRYGNNPPEARNKPVLLPGKVDQALNLNSGDTNSHISPHFNVSFASNYDAFVAQRNALLTQARGNYRAEGGQNLPQEWTY